MTDKIIISLFDFSGIWSSPYRRAGYIVIQVDIKLGISIFDFDYKSICKTKVHGILAAPPCLDFSKVGAYFWKKKDVTGITSKSVKLVRSALDIIYYFNPNFWSLEQPPGRIEHLFPELSKYRLLSYQPHEFGAPYTKLTTLYGNFNPFLTRTPIIPISPTAKGQMSIDNYQIHHQLKTIPRNKRSEYRSITPIEFAESFFLSNP